VVGGYAGEDFHVIDVETANIRRLQMPRDESLMSVAWSPDGKHIAAGTFGHSVPVMDAKGRLEFFLEGHSGSAWWVDWSRDSSRLLTGSDDGTAKVWELTPQGATEVQTLSARAGAITGVAFSPDGARVMTRSDQRVMDVWDVGPTGGAEIANIADAAQLVSFLQDGRHVTTSGRDGSLSTLDLQTGEQVHRRIGWFDPPRGLFEGYVFNRDGSAVAIMDIVPQEFTTLRDVETGATLYTKPGFPAPVDWSPDGRFLAVNDDDGIAILDASGRQVGDLRPEGFTIGEGLLFGPGGLVAIPGVKIWDWRRDVIVAELPVPTDHEAMRFDADGSRIAIGTAETTIWDVRNERLLATLPSSQVMPNDLAFSPDGSRLAEADPDGSVRIYDTGSGEEVLVLQGHDDAGQVAFSPDGSMLATQGDGILRIWALDIDDLLQIARREVTRSLTDEECRQYLHVDSCPS
jgi:WD40 repeat protein